VSETPQDIVTLWLDESSAVLTTPPEVREAIRDVLAQLRQAEILGDQAEQEREEDAAERDALRAQANQLKLECGKAQNALAVLATDGNGTPWTRQVARRALAPEVKP